MAKFAREFVPELVPIFRLQYEKPTTHILPGCNLAASQHSHQELHEQVKKAVLSITKDTSVGPAARFLVEHVAYLVRSEGGDQGDTIMMLLYAGSQASTLSTCAENVKHVSGGLAYVGSLVDDKWLVFPFDHVEKVIEVFVPPFQRDLNQVPALSKFRIFAPAWEGLGSRPEQLKGPLAKQVIWDEHGLVQLGAPLGSDLFQQQFCLAFSRPPDSSVLDLIPVRPPADASSSEVLRAVALLDDPHREWAAVTVCVLRKHTYRLRVTPPSNTAPLAAHHDKLILEALVHILPALADAISDPWVMFQLRTPVSDGGGGISSAVIEQDVLYVSSVLDALASIVQRLVAQGLDDWARQFPACLPEFNDALVRVREAVTATGKECALATLVVPAFDALMEAKPRSGTQRIVMSALASHGASSFSALAPSDVAVRLKSCSGTGAYWCWRVP
jgi:hypothetical protein